MASVVRHYTRSGKGAAKKAKPFLDPAEHTEGSWTLWLCPKGISTLQHMGVYARSGGWGGGGGGGVVFPDSFVTYRAQGAVHSLGLGCSS